MTRGIRICGPGDSRPQLSGVANVYKQIKTAGIVALLIASVAFISVADAKPANCGKRQSGKNCWPTEPPPASNTAPTITGDPSPSVMTDQSYAFAPAVSDADGDTLALSIVNRPPWASFNSSTGRLSGIPHSADAGEYVDIRISVSDGSATVSLPAFSIEVQQLAAQHPVSLTVVGAGLVEDSANGILCTGTCSYTFAEGRTLSLTQEAAAGAHFTSWSGACSTAQQCSVVVSGPLSITATFDADSTLPTPPPPPPSGTLAKLLNFAETWDRNWNFDGHSVTSQFTSSQGWWDYTDTTSEPWLFDRATVGYRLYQLTADQRWKTKFLSDFAYYRVRIDSQGIFTPKGGGDTKYSYVTPFLLYERETGDTQYRPVAKRIYDAWVRDWSSSFQPTGQAQLWTEREMAFALESAISYYEMTSDPVALTRAHALVQQWKTASGSVGAPLVTYTQHEGGGPGGTEPQNLTNSPWMSALYFQALRRYYAITQNPEALLQVSRYADYCQSACYYDASLAHSQYAGLFFPRYLTGDLIGDAGYDYGNMGHCLDQAGMLKFAIEAKQARGESLTAVNNRYAQMQACADRDFTEWTRSTTYLPKYRVNPPRKFNWQLRGYFEAAQ